MWFMNIFLDEYGGIAAARQFGSDWRSGGGPSTTFGGQRRCDLLKLSEEFMKRDRLSKLCARNLLQKISEDCPQQEMHFIYIKIMLLILRNEIYKI